ncbi:MAG: response regulator, partial [Desulfomonilia bacterium]
MGASLILKKTRVLIVDDEQETLDLIEEYLVGRDFDVTTTMSGEQAVAIVQKDLFHIAIVDLHLPGMTGAELLKSMKNIR